MAEVVASALRVELIADDGEHREQLRDMLVENGVDVVAESTLAALAGGELTNVVTDVILIDLVEEPDVLGLESLIEAAPAPILFSENAMLGGRGWDRKLINKLTTLAQRGREIAAPAVPAPAEPVPIRPNLQVVSDQAAAESAPDVSAVCVLGASIGGPEAIKQFVAHLPADLPVAFLLAQHIGAGFDGRLASQLDRVSRLEVRKAQTGDRLQASVILVVPTDGLLVIGADGRLQVSDEPWSGAYSPTIDDVLDAAAERYGADVGTILFSGMGDDGARGAMAVEQAGGYVWAQDEASCVISSIPDAARRRGVVSFSGSPEELAKQLIRRSQQGLAVGD